MNSIYPKLDVYQGRVQEILAAGDISGGASDTLPEQLRGKYVYGVQSILRVNFPFNEVVDGFKVYGQINNSFGNTYGLGDVQSNPFCGFPNPEPLNPNAGGISVAYQFFLNAPFSVVADMTIDYFLFYSNDSVGRLQPLGLQNVFLLNSIKNG